MDRTALADFLTRRRAELQPADVGLGPGLRRRTPGLRREEVAQLAAMSTDYYTRLEQRRGPQPSPEMLAALCRALRLSADERDYVHRLAGHPAPERIARDGYIAPGLQRVLDSLRDTPAMILTSLEETLVMNGPARALFGEQTALQGWERSAIHRWFMDPDHERVLYPEADHARQSRSRVASLRAAMGREGPGSRPAQLAALLERRSEEFARLWQEHRVARRFEDHKVLLHPEVGALDLDCQALFTEDCSQVLLVLSAPPRSETASRLELLAMLGIQA